MPVSLDFVAPPQLVATAVHTCMRPGDPEAGVAVVNLKRLSWAEPAGLVAIAVFMESQWRIGRRPHLYGPIDESRARYLKRMRLGELVERFDGVHDLPGGREYDHAGRLLELQRFDGTQEAEGLARLVETQLDDGPVAAAIPAAICEIGANVADHSTREHGYIAAVTTHGGTQVSFAVGDAGVGLLEPLQEQGYTSSGEVIETLFSRRGVTRTGQVGRGNGVYRTKELVTNSRGSVYMASGRYARTAWAGRDHELTGTLSLPGTLLQGTLPC